MIQMLHNNIWINIGIFIMAITNHKLFILTHIIIPIYNSAIKLWFQWTRFSGCGNKISYHSLN